MRIEGVAWNRNDLLAEPPPLAMNRACRRRRSPLGPRRRSRPAPACSTWCSAPRTWRWAQLRIAQVALEVGVARAFGERRLVVAVGEHEAALLAHDDGGAGVLAHGQHAAGRDIGVLEKIVGHELVVVARLGIVEDRAQLLEMPGPQQMINVAEGGFGERAQRLAFDHHELSAAHALEPHALARELAIGRLVLAEREQRRMLIGRGDLGGGVHGDPAVRQM